MSANARSTRRTERPTRSPWAHAALMALSVLAAGPITAGCQAPGEGAPGYEGGLPPLDDGGGATGDAGGPGDGGAAACGARAYFEQTAWPKVFQTCTTCHVPGGQSGGTRFVMRPWDAPDAMVANFQIVARAARSLVEGGQSLLVLKSTQQVAHGGGVVVAADSPNKPILDEMVRRLRDPAEAAACGLDTRSPFDGVVLADAHDTLRKAAIELVGRLPTAAEYAQAEAGDPATLSGLDPVLLAMMQEKAFYERLKDLWNDLLLTDKARLENTTGGLVGSSVPRRLMTGAPYCESVNWFNYSERTKTPESYTCMQASEALGREPVELIAHVVREGRPFTEILTAQYRYFSAQEAKIFGLDPAPWAGHENEPDWFAETRFPAMHGPAGLPEEYAGVLTTNAFMYRYNSTSSNRNRGRAHYFYKFFLDKDVMKSATRIDLSSVDQSKSPWKNDPQCTGCHASIDPVAGAFQHWTNCYDIHQVEYYETRYCGRNGWFDESDMFPPGVGLGDGNRLAKGDVPTALAHLAGAAVKDPGFARAVAALTYTGLAHLERLDPPRLPNALDYSARYAGYDAQVAAIEALAQDFAKGGFDYKKLVVAVIKTPGFRAVDADRADRAELDAIGGGALIPPEVRHRKIAAVVGATWSTPGGAAEPFPSPTPRDPPHWLLSLQKFRLFAGGMDSVNVRKRSRQAGALTVATQQRMALEMACHYTAYDFALDVGRRALFPRVERTLVPSGNAAAPDQAPILDELVYLHERMLGERLTPADPEVLETYALLVSLQQAGKAAIGAGKAQPTLAMECAARLNRSTGALLPMAQQWSADPDYVVRAWQGVITYLLMDYRFGFEP